MTVTKEHDTATNSNAFTASWTECFAGSPSEPGGGTMRVLDVPVMPGLFVEIETMAARRRAGRAA